MTTSPQTSAFTHATSTGPDAPDRAPAAVRLLDVHKSYVQGVTAVPALRGVSLAFPEGSFTALMGPSGSGKSTLLLCAAGLDSPDRGHVIIGTHDISAFSADALTRFRRDHIGFVFQSYNLVAHLDVAANIELPLTLGGRQLEPGWRDELLAAVGLAGLANRRPSELSGGQAQRVAIARALAMRPTVVYADEPTGALDSRTAPDVLGVFKRTASQLGQTVVMVTHDPNVAATADRVVFLDDGLIAGAIDAPTAVEVSRHALTWGR